MDSTHDPNLLAPLDISISSGYYSNGESFTFITSNLTLYKNIPNYDFLKIVCLWSKTVKPPETSHIKPNLNFQKVSLEINA